jgi:hypothetical protein
MTDPIRSGANIPSIPLARPVQAAAPGPVAPGMAGDAMQLSGQVDPMADAATMPRPAGKYKGLEELAAKTRTEANTWFFGRPLSEGLNAHKTNTTEQMEEALKGDFNFFECDLRREINPPHRPECRHDPGQEPGDNLLLSEWLQIGKRSGRGLKFDIKEGEATPAILDEIAKSGVPDERLMFNLGDGDMAKFEQEIRSRFPLATIAINPASSLDGRENDGPMQDWQVDRMIDLAEQAGQPVTFVVRYDLLTDAAIAKLKQHGTISVWNEMGGPKVDDPAKVIQGLKDRGVNGVVDIRATPGLKEKVEIGLEYVHGKAEDLKDKAEHVLDKIF